MISDDNGLVTATVFNIEIGEVENKIPDVSGLVTTVVPNAKIGEVENKTLFVSGLVKKNVYDTTILHIEGKYFTTSDYNKFMSDILDAKIKEKELLNKSNISNLIKNSGLNLKLKTSARKAELKAEQDKMVKLQSHLLSYFLGKIFSGDVGFQNMFVYQPRFSMLELKDNKGTDYVIDWESKGVYTSKLT